MIAMGIAFLASIVLSGYLWDRYLQQAKKNPTTADWAIAFFMLALTEGLYLLIRSNIVSAHSELSIVIAVLKMLFSTLFILFIYIGIMGLVSRSHLIRVTIPFLSFLAAVSWAIFGFVILEDPQLTIWVFSYIFQIPFTIAVMIAFLMLFTQIHLYKERISQNLGPLFLTIAFALLAVFWGVRPFVEERPEYDAWFLGRAAISLLIFIGILRLETELKQTIETKMRFHKLKPKEMIEKPI